MAQNWQKTSSIKLCDYFHLVVIPSLIIHPLQYISILSDTPHATMISKSPYQEKYGQESTVGCRTLSPQTCRMLASCQGLNLKLQPHKIQNLSSTFLLNCQQYIEDIFKRLLNGTPVISNINTLAPQAQNKMGVVIGLEVLGGVWLMRSTTSRLNCQVFY